MPVGYGSSFELPKLAAGEVAQEVPVQNASLISFFRILITIAEVGLSLIPGVGIAIGTGIAVGAAAANTVLDAESGTLSPTGVLLNFGSALIPGAIGGVKALRPVVLSEMATARLGVFGVDLIDELPKIENTFQKAITNGSQTAGKLRRYEINSTFKLLEKNGFKDSSFFDRFVKAVNPGRASAVIEGTESTEEDIRKVEKLSGVTAREASELEELLKYTSTQAEREVLIVNYLRDLGKLEVLRELAPLATDKEIIKIMKQGERVILDDPNKWKKKVRSFLESLGRPNSTEFNDNFVQKVQLLFDGNDAGRAPIEFAYGKVKKYLSKKFDRLGKILGKADKLEDAYTKTGGVIVDSSVVLGYKIIHTIGYQSLVQISFYPQPTRSKKNPDGKLPVYVFASKKELKNLRQRGMSYYDKKWATSKNGKSNGFAMAVQSLFGGLTFFTGMFKIGAIKNILSLASNLSTGFFGKGGISEHGVFTGAWEAKFAKSFSRNWKNRVGRLTGRVVLGGLATATLGRTIGSFIGKEAQRAASQYVIPSLTGSKMGSWKNALATSLQSNLRRVARNKNPNSAALGSLSAIRKGQIVQRLPGSFTAGNYALSNWKVKIPR